MNALSKFFMASVYASASHETPDPDAHQKWRLLITSNNGHATNWGVGEILLYDRAGVNYALSSLGATASSSGDNFGVPSVTIDGVASSNWIGSGISGKWLEVDLPAKRNIVKIGLTTISDTTVNQSLTPKIADIQYYDTTLLAWVTKWTMDGTGKWTTNAAGALKTFTDPAEWQTAFSAVTNTQNAGWSGYTLREHIDNSRMLVSGTKGRLSMLAGDGGLSIGKMYIGRSLDATFFRFDETPIQVKFDGGSASKTAAGGTLIVSDEFDMPTAGFDNFLISIYMTAGDLVQNDTGDTLTSRVWNNIGDEAGNTALASEQAHSTKNYVTLIEVHS